MTWYLGCLVVALFVAAVFALQHRRLLRKRISHLRRQRTHRSRKCVLLSFCLFGSVMVPTYAFQLALILAERRVSAGVSWMPLAPRQVSIVALIVAVLVGFWLFSYVDSEALLESVELPPSRLLHNRRLIYVILQSQHALSRAYRDDEDLNLDTFCTNLAGDIIAAAPDPSLGKLQSAMSLAFARYMSSKEYLKESNTFQRVDELIAGIDERQGIHSALTIILCQIAAVRGAKQEHFIDYLIDHQEIFFVGTD